MTIAELVKTKREEAGMSQFQLAIKTGITATSICKIEKGHCVPSLESRKKIAAALDCDLQEFVNVQEVHMLTPEEKKELERLKGSKEVKATNKAIRKKVSKEKQRLYNLRWKFKKGQELLAGQGGI